MNSDNERYAKYKEDLSNSFAAKDDEYPTIVSDAFTAVDLFKFYPGIYKTKQVKTPDLIVHHHTASSNKL